MGNIEVLGLIVKRLAAQSINSNSLEGFCKLFTLMKLCYLFSSRCRTNVYVFKWFVVQRPEEYIALMQQCEGLVKDGFSKSKALARQKKDTNSVKRLINIWYLYNADHETYMQVIIGCIDSISTML